ncbi:MAG TPA: hypothetical protein VLB09_08770 [Nitrospiria bacterium]|nr:hypothetical protein [Nitrospiria bacterium]
MPRIIERHQIEGLDERRRVFNRLTDIQREDKGYSALFHYEGLTFKTPPSRTIEATLEVLIGQLREKGFSNLRTRLNFRGKRYFAEREAWVVHQDPEPITP